jgi:hypothetical protein
LLIKAKENRDGAVPVLNIDTVDIKIFRECQEGNDETQA